MPGHGVPLGAISDATYASFSLSPSSGSLLVLYTDGLIEYKRDLIGGEERLMKAVQHVVASGVSDPASALRDEIFRDGRPVDDVAVLTLRFSGLESAERDTGFMAVEALKLNGAAIEAPLLTSGDTRQADVGKPPCDRTWVPRGESRSRRFAIAE